MSDSFTRKDTYKYTREFAYYYEDKDKARYEDLYKYAQEPLQLNDNVYGIEKSDPRLKQLTKRDITNCLIKEILLLLENKLFLLLKISLKVN